MGANVPKSIKEISQERFGLYEANKALLALADSEGRNLNTEEQSQYDKRDKDIETLSAELNEVTNNETRRQRLESLGSEMDRPLPRQTSGRGDPKPSTLAHGGDGATISLNLGRSGTFELKPDHPLYKRATAEYEAAQLGYLTYGDKSPQNLALQVGNDPKGGYLVGTSLLSEIVKFLDDEVIMRKLCRVLPPTTAKSVGVLSFDTDYSSPDWTPEIPASALSENDAARWGKREMTPHLVATYVQAGMKLIRSASIGAEGFIAQRAAYLMGIKENAAFLSGDGQQKPLGIFTASNDGVTTARDKTCAATTAFTMDELIDQRGMLKPGHLAKAVWLVHRDFMTRLRKLKYGTGEYIMGINGDPDLLLGRPVYQDENAPSTFTTGLYIAALFNPEYYWIQDTPDWEVQFLNDSALALKNKVGWVFRKETDGMPVLNEAFTRLKLG